MQIEGTIVAINDNDKNKVIILTISPENGADGTQKNIQVATNDQQLLDGIKRGQLIKLSIEPI